MIHNRTVLWKYHNTSNQESDCQGILRRVSWLPSYDEWSERLVAHDVFTQEEFIPVPLLTDDKNLSQWQQDEQNVRVALYPQISDVLAERSDIARSAWSNHPMDKKDYQKYIMELDQATQATVGHLYSDGKEFLYGMLYSNLFTLLEPAVPKLVNSSNANTTYEISLALHSRHTVAADDGSYISDELKCLEKMLPHLDKPYDCRVYLMSDRQATIDKLTGWLVHERNCTVVTAEQHETSGSSDTVQEHGPWAGIGFLQDLDLTANARHGVIGDKHRSSTALLLELVEYRRRLVAWKKKHNEKDCDTPTPANPASTMSSSIAPLQICQLPKRSISGYNYGPDTPTYRHHSYLEPLPPIQVLDDYVNNVATRGRKDGGAYVTAAFDCDEPTPEAVYAVLNSKFETDTIHVRRGSLRTLCLMRSLRSRQVYCLHCYGIRHSLSSKQTAKNPVQLRVVF